MDSAVEGVVDAAWSDRSPVRLVCSCPLVSQRLCVSVSRPRGPGCPCVAQLSSHHRVCGSPKLGFLHLRARLSWLCRAGGLCHLFLGLLIFLSVDVPRFPASVFTLVTSFLQLCRPPGPWGLGESPASSATSLLDPPLTFACVSPSLSPLWGPVPPPHKHPDFCPPRQPSFNRGASGFSSRSPCGMTR